MYVEELGKVDLGDMSGHVDKPEQADRYVRMDMSEHVDRADRAGGVDHGGRSGYGEPSGREEWSDHGEPHCDMHYGQLGTQDRHCAEGDMLPLASASEEADLAVLPPQASKRGDPLAAARLGSYRYSGHAQILTQSLRKSLNLALPVAVVDAVAVPGVFCYMLGEQYAYSRVHFVVVVVVAAAAADTDHMDCSDSDQISMLGPILHHLLGLKGL